MTRSLVARLRDDVGTTTAEYAVVTAAGCGFGAVLLRLLMSDFGQSLLKKVFSVFLGMIGLG
jgi:Flp pilus assembly pilin Flp